MPNQNLLARLETIRGNYTLGLLFCGLLRNPKTRSTITLNRVFLTQARTWVFFPEQPISLPPNEKHYELRIGGPDDQSGMDHMIDQFSTMLLRNLILDTFEVIRDYCKATGQLQLMRSQPWYQFARLLRNAVTHDQCWIFKDYDRSILPACWRGKCIEVGMEGQEVKTAFFGWFDGCELFLEMFTFAKDLA